MTRGREWKEMQKQHTGEGARVRIKGRVRGRVWWYEEGVKVGIAGSTL